MIHIVYASSAVAEFSKPQLHELLQKSQANNQKVGVTGLLLYRGGNFMQAIEGEETPVRALYKKVCQDPRHKGIFTLLDEEISTREFPDWSMAFQDLEIQEGDDIPGYSEFLSPNWTSGDGDVVRGRARKLLDCFKTRLR